MLTGYTDRLSARPGEIVSFMVSTDAEVFNASILRLIHGDDDARGPGRREIPVATPVSGVYPGVVQTLQPGSHVVVADHEDLRCAGAFTVFFWICPTRLASGEQAILSKDGLNDAGYSIGLTEAGHLFLRIGGARIEGATRVLERRWQWVAAQYDTASGSARILGGVSPRDLSRVGELGGVGLLVATPPSLGPLTIAASMKAGHACSFFNGLIADPCLFAKILTDQEIASLLLGLDGNALLPSCIAAWDFSLVIGSDKICDVAGRALHGVARQSPVRAMTGPHWTGESDDPQVDPRGYAAIHFHEDSLTDAEWRESFAFTIPPALSTGVYAALLKAGAEIDYLPFCVSPPEGRATASLALLLPTFTYVAYGNELREEYGLNCVYDCYLDGAGVPFASIRHPLKNLRPERGLLKSVEGESFARHLCADLYVVDWLNAIGQAVDVITDHDLHREGKGLLERYDGVMTGSHPEYVSGQILDALEGYLGGGGSLAYFGGNGFYSVTTLSADGSTIEVRRPNGSRPWASDAGEGRHAMTGEIGGLWRFRGRAPQRLIGVGFTAQGWTPPGNECALPRPYEQVGDRTHPLAAALLAGIPSGVAIGDYRTLGLGIGAAGDEVDRADPLLGTPAHAVVLATARNFSTGYQLVIEERLEVNSASTSLNDPRVRSDIVSFETPSGGVVFSVGSMQWFSALFHNHYSNSVTTITHNVLNLMLRQKDGDRVSDAN